MKAIILNLKKDKERRSLLHPNLKAKGYPKEKILFYPCHDGLTAGKKTNSPYVVYPNGEDAEFPQTANVILAAIADGFPFFKNVFKWNLIDKQNIQMYTQFWNYCRIFRDIEAQAEVCMVTHDDILLNFDYTEINNLISEITGLGAFKFLHAFFKPKAGEPQDTSQPTHIDGIYKGIQGPGDKAFIISPKGAQWILERLSTTRVFNFRHYNSLMLKFRIDPRSEV